MRNLIVTTLALSVALIGCGANTENETETAAVEGVMPDDDVHRQAAGMPEDDAHGSAMAGMGMGGGLNTDISVDAAIADAWSGISVRVVDIETGDESSFEIALGKSVGLGDSGLTLTATAFVPDFVMDESGITSRSAETHNPAARVVIEEEGTADYEGWLFAKMPEIHPFPHSRYQVLLEEGIPAE
jgi:hypothetical protein